jgi:hypothetical protein
MEKKQPDPDPRYRLIGVEKDGRETVLMTGMSLEDATSAQPGIVATGDYANTRVEPDRNPHA